MNFFRALRRDLWTINDDYVLPSFESGNQPVPLILNKPGFPAQTSGERVREIDLEPDDPSRISDIGKRIWRPAFGICRPDEFLRRSGWSRSQQEQQ